MRRKNREVTKQAAILEIIEECKVCRLGLNDHGRVYVIPLNFGFLLEERTLTLYFHSARIGRKIDVLKQNPEVGFEMDCRHGLVSGDTACAHTYHYASLIGTGKASIIDGKEDKRKALSLIMSHLTGSKEHEFEEKWLDAAAIIKVDAVEYSCKHNEPVDPENWGENS